jgi:hypothetical protein
LIPRKQRISRIPGTQRTPSGPGISVLEGPWCPSFGFHGIHLCKNAQTTTVPPTRKAVTRGEDLKLPLSLVPALGFVVFRQLGGGALRRTLILGR